MEEKGEGSGGRCEAEAGQVCKKRGAQSPRLLQAWCFRMGVRACSGGGHSSVGLSPTLLVETRHLPLSSLAPPPRSHCLGRAVVMPSLAAKELAMNLSSRGMRVRKHTCDYKTCTPTQTHNIEVRKHYQTFLIKVFFNKLMYFNVVNMIAQCYIKVAKVKIPGIFI